MQPKTETMRVVDLIKELRKLPQGWPVYFSKDPEGNGFGSLKADMLVGGSNEDKVVVLYPIDSSLTDEDIMPIQVEQIMKEIEEKHER